MLLPEETRARAGAVLEQVGRVIVGKDDVLELVVLGILAGGHVLIEDLPGLGKTVLARTFADVLGLTFTRVQFTPDLLPQDLVGSAVYDQRSGEFTFRAGPVFTQVLLADEINRTPPKTQSALLEAMAESQVSVDGVTHALPQPFITLATQNPIEYEGTYSLPEAQLDRFTIRIRLGYLSDAGEAEMVRRRLERRSDRVGLEQVVNADDLKAMIESVEQVEVHDDVVAYVVALVQATRGHPKVLAGASPRGTLAVTQLARGAAMLAGRTYVTPEDVKRVARPALGHRLVLRPELWVRRESGDDIVGEVLDQVPTPQTQPELGNPEQVPKHREAAPAADR